MRAVNGQAGKIVVPLLSVVMVLAMGVAGAATYLLIQERQTRQAKEQELRLARAETEDLQGQLEEIRALKTRMDEELARVRLELNGAAQDLANALEAQETLARSVEDREQEIGRLAKKLEEAEQASSTVASQLTALQAERDAATRQLTEVEQAKNELEAKIIELSSDEPTVELDKIRVSAARYDGNPMGVAPVSVVAAEGQVVVINRDYEFIVVNLGRNHGLSVGQEFQIVRGDEVLGRVKVEKVYDELSAAAILPESQTQNIREGDRVRAL